MFSFQLFLHKKILWATTIVYCSFFVKKKTSGFCWLAGQYTVPLLQMTGEKLADNTAGQQA